MTDQDMLPQMQARIDHLVELAGELTNGLAKQARVMEAIEAAIHSQSTSSVKITDEQRSMLMKLPTELRLDILERVLPPVFDATPYGLIMTDFVPSDTRFLKTYKFPAVLHVNRTIRLESIQVFLDFAKHKIAGLERKKRDLSESHSNMEKYRAEVASHGSRVASLHMRIITVMNDLSAKIEQNEMDIKGLESACHWFNGQ